MFSKKNRYRVYVTSLKDLAELTNAYPYALTLSKVA